MGIKSLNSYESERKKLKAMAALEGVTLQEYIRNHAMKQNASNVVSESKFNKLLDKILNEHDEVLRRLADR